MGKNQRIFQVRVEKIMEGLGKNDLTIRASLKSPKRTEEGVLKGKRSLLACHNCHKCSMGTSCVFCLLK